VSNRTVLDVGANLGFFTIYSLLNGARSAVGVEANRVLASCAALICQHVGVDHCGVICSDGMAYLSRAACDVLILSSVYHHLYLQLHSHEELWQFIAKTKASIVLYEGPLERYDQYLVKASRARKVPESVLVAFSEDAITSAAQAFTFVSERREYSGYSQTRWLKVFVR
jgi:hypothetical protein